MKNLLEYLDDEIKLGITLYDSHVSFLRIDEEDKEISILRGIDTDSPECPLSFPELFFNVKTQKEMILSLLEYIE